MRNFNRCCPESRRVDNQPGRQSRLGFHAVRAGVIKLEIEAVSESRLLYNAFQTMRACPTCCFTSNPGRRQISRFGSLFAWTGLTDAKSKLPWMVRHFEGMDGVLCFAGFQVSSFEFKVCDGLGIWKALTLSFELAERGAVSLPMKMVHCPAFRDRTD
jgi:hypothetical protein